MQAKDGRRFHFLLQAILISFLIAEFDLEGRFGPANAGSTVTSQA